MRTLRYYLLLRRQTYSEEISDHTPSLEGRLTPPPFLKHALQPTLPCGIPPQDPASQDPLLTTFPSSLPWVGVPWVSHGVALPEMTFHFHDSGHTHNPEIHSEIFKFTFQTPDLESFKSLPNSPTTISSVPKIKAQPYLPSHKSSKW